MVFGIYATRNGNIDLESGLYAYGVEAKDLEAEIRHLEKEYPNLNWTIIYDDGPTYCPVA